MTKLVIPGDGNSDEPPSGDETVSLGSYASGGSRYRILRPIGEGGVGEVWLARDVELNREVAVKQLQTRHREKADFRRRFLREVKATAALEHPSIIPVYDIGQHPDGTLFQVMRYFGEENFHSQIRAYHRAHPSVVDETAFRGLLGHFIAACRAIAYVHARDVVHLDIKPANIVTGEFGETQVIDWGMAWIKGQALWEQVADESGALSGGASGGDSAARSGGKPETGNRGGAHPVPDMTKPVGFRGTPVFAAPEQHRGRWDAIGPRTDVYGLGATLFFLLADKAPFNKDSDTFHADVVAGHLHAAPKSWVPPALVAIARKAMAVDPANRYASANDLADDVDRFLADEPVAAFPDPWQTRLWRQVKRHRASTAAAAALLATSSLALGVGYVAVSNERDVANVERDRSRKAEAEAEEQRDIAVAAKDEATRQARIARENAAATRGVIAGFIENVADDRWAAIPGTATLRLEAVRQVLEEFPRIIAQQPEDPDLRYDAARIERRCANLFRVLGRLQEAEPLYERARRGLDDLVRLHPGDDRFSGQRAELMVDIGEVLRRTAGPESALATFREALADAAAGKAARPDSLHELQTLSRAQLDLADALVDAGHLDEAGRLARQAVEGFARLNGENGSWDEANSIVARVLEAMARAVAARAAMDAGNDGDAEALARSADRQIASIASLSEDLAENPDVRHLQGWTLMLLGRVLCRDAATRAEGEEAAGRSLDILRRLVAGNGDVANFRPTLAEALCDRAESFLEGGDAAGAGACADESIAVIDPLDAPEKAFEAKRHLARAHALRGRAAHAAMDPVAAREHLRDARLAYDAAIMGAPSNEKLRDEAALVERLLTE